MPILIRLRPHQSTLIMLHPHDTLWTIQLSGTILGEDAGIDQIGNGNINRGIWLRLEPQLAVPGHILYGHQRPIGDNDHIKVSVPD